MGPIPTGKDFVPKVEDFVHKAFDFVPTVSYLTRREYFDLEILETVHLEDVYKQHTG